MGTQKPLPEVGKIYPLSSSPRSLYRVLCHDRGQVKMQHTVTGWTFYARGVRLYEDGTVDWAYSVGGRFEEVIHDNHI